MGFDNGRPRVDSGLPQKFDFALFTFGSMVDVMSVSVDDVSNFGRDLFVAAGSEAADFSNGRAAALADFDIFIGDDDASDGPFNFTLSFEGVTSVLVGALPQSDDGPIAGIAAAVGGTGQFFIDALGFSVPGMSTNPEDRAWAMAMIVTARSCRRSCRLRSRCRHRFRFSSRGWLV